MTYVNFISLIRGIAPNYVASSHTPIFSKADLMNNIQPIICNDYII